MSRRIRRAGLLALLAALVTIALSPATAHAAGTRQMYRLYNPNSGEHFYTASEAERNMLDQVGWRYEGVGWTAPTSSNTPVFRLYNPNAGDHHYTTSDYERDSLVKAGWRYEGIGWYGVKVGGSSSNPDTPSNPTTPTQQARYSYDVYYLDGMGDTWYNGTYRTLYVKTSNPDGSFSIDGSGGTYTAPSSLASGYYRDIDDQGSVNGYLKVPGGYVVRLAIAGSRFGSQSLTVYEKTGSGSSSQVKAGSFTMILADSEQAQIDWANSVIARYGGGTTDPLEKLRKVVNGLSDEFKYYYNDGTYIVNLAAHPNNPYYVTGHWDSYASPAALCIVAEQIGGFEKIENAYYEYPRDSYEWKRLHASVKVTYKGEAHYLDAYPSVSSSSGRIDPSAVEKINFSNLTGATFDHVG